MKQIRISSNGNEDNKSKRCEHTRKETGACIDCEGNSKNKIMDLLRFGIRRFILSNVRSCFHFIKYWSHSTKTGKNLRHFRRGCRYLVLPLHYSSCSGCYCHCQYRSKSNEAHIFTQTKSTSSNLPMFNKCLKWYVLCMTEKKIA